MLFRHSAVYCNAAFCLIEQATSLLVRLYGPIDIKIMQLRVFPSLQQLKNR